MGRRGGRRQEFLFRLRALEVVAEIFLDGRDPERILLAGEADRDARRARAAGPADAVHVILGVVRQVVVDDVADSLDVNAAGGDVGGHDHRNLSFAEIAQGADPFFLRHLAGKQGAADAEKPEPVRQFPGLVAAVREDQGRLPAAAGQEVVEEIEFFRRGDDVRSPARPIRRRHAPARSPP